MAIIRCFRSLSMTAAGVQVRWTEPESRMHICSAGDSRRAVRLKHHVRNGLEQRRSHVSLEIPDGVPGVASAIAATAAETTPQTPGKVQQQFWVSPAGSDDNPGTETKPFATIQHARSAVRRLNQQMTRGRRGRSPRWNLSVSGDLGLRCRGFGDGGIRRRLQRAFRRDAGRERRPRRHRLAAGCGRALEGPHGRRQLPTVLRETENGRFVPVDPRLRASSSSAPTATRRRRWRWPTGETQGDIELCFYVVWWTTRGARSRASSAKATRRSSPCSSPTSPTPEEGRRAGGTARLHRERLGTARRAGRVVSRPAGQDCVLHPPARPGHDQGRGDRPGGRETRRAARHAGPARRERPLRGHHLRRGRLAAAQRDRPGRRAGQLLQRFQKKYTSIKPA